MKKLVTIIISFFVFISLVKGYKEYKIGDVVNYNDIDFYVIENSANEDDTIVLLKAKSLSYDEVKRYLNKADASLVNNIVKFDNNDYGYIPYYLNDQCNVFIDGQHITTGCITSYNQSDIKKVVDEWVDDKLDKNYLVPDSDGNYARLINEKELFTNLGFQVERTGINSYQLKENITVPDFLYDFTYWTMIPSPEREYNVMQIMELTTFGNSKNILGYMGQYLNDTYNVAAVRPVITLNKQSVEKTVIEGEETKANELELDELGSNDEISNNDSNLYDVPDTLGKISKILIVLGIILILISSFIFVKRIIKSKE